MEFVNRAMTALFDVLMPIFGVAGPTVALILISGIVGVLGLLIFKQISWQGGIKSTKDKIKGGLIEIRLYQDDLGIVAKAVGKVLGRNFQYLFLNFGPIVPLLVPFGLAFAQLVVRQGFDPIPIETRNTEELLSGEGVMVEVQLADAAKGRVGELEIDLPPTLEAISPIVRSVRGPCLRRGRRGRPRHGRDHLPGRRRGRHQGGRHRRHRAPEAPAARARPRPFPLPVARRAHPRGQLRTNRDSSSRASRRGVRLVAGSARRCHGDHARLPSVLDRHRRRRPQAPGRADLSAPPAYSPAVERAIRVALAAHEGQTRKGAPDEPYVVHPLQIALLLARLGADDLTLQAAVLHDVIEDSPDWWYEDLAREFGPDVADVVAELTEDKSKTWEERKRAGIEAVPDYSEAAATVKAADKLHNLESMAAALEAAADSATFWKPFHGGRERTLQMSGELVKALAARVAPELGQPLSAAYARLRHAAGA
ncbi:MAG: HD domain-containing protein [Planctomycetota bacterium]